MAKNIAELKVREGRVLIVDDSRLNRVKLTMAVGNLGHQSSSVSDGIEALTALKQGSYDVVLLDINMPNMDGFEVLERLRNDESLRHIPVIVVSALEDMEDIIASIKLGAIDFLPNNFDIVLLEARINACLEKKRSRDHEIKTLSEVRRLTDAASELDRDEFNPKRSGIQDIALRSDDLGRLALVLLNKSIEVYNRQLGHKQQIKTLMGTLSLLFMGACFGLKPALAKLSISGDVNPLGVTLYAVAFTAAFTIIFALVRRCPWPSMDWQTLKYYSSWAMLTAMIPQILLFWIAGHLQGIIISIILTLEAFIVFFISAFLKIEAITKRRFIGLSLGITAILIILYPAVVNSGSGSEIAWLLVAMCIPLCFALEGILVSARKSEESDPISDTAVVFGIATVLMLAVVWATDSFVPFHYPFGNFEAAVMTFGIVEAVGSIALVMLIRSSGSVFASQKAYTVAVAGIVWSIVLLGETLALLSVVGLFLALLGIYLVAQQPKKEELLRPYLDQVSV
jgi:DNA-binding response OmpR family regulator/drug/metabolite transporter (DMT)-like permease